MQPKGKVLVAMSGGVDSSVTAALLQQEGWEVVGATLQYWDCQDGIEGKCCSGITGITAARAVAKQLDIPHNVIDAGDRFEDEILAPAWHQYSHGLTPNPCLTCNKLLKFGLLQDQATKLGASHMATGHYAQILPGPELHRGKNTQKDQSYFLAYLAPTQLARTILPLGKYSKPEVRELARGFALPTAENPESQDACLDQEGFGFAETLRRVLGQGAQPGHFIDPEGKILGEHQGVHKFTIGQRKGLGIALGKPAFVVAINPETRAVVLSTNLQDLDDSGLVAGQVNWQTEPDIGVPFTAQVQVRSRPTVTDGQVTRQADGKVNIQFSTPVRAIAPGQAAVIYSGERVIGAGWIESVSK